MLVQNAVKQPQSVKAVVKTIKSKSIANQSEFISQEKRTITPDSPVWGAGITALEEKSLCAISSTEEACEVIAGLSWGLIRASGSYSKSIGQGFLYGQNKV
jgi:hypothetical protein